MKRRFRPKEWPRPGSRRTRNKHAQLEAGWDSSRVMTEILKDNYSDGRERPAWAKLANKYGWLTLVQYLLVEPTAPGRNLIRELAYAESPFLRLLKKDTNFGAVAYG